MQLASNEHLEVVMDSKGAAKLSARTVYILWICLVTTIITTISCLPSYFTMSHRDRLRLPESKLESEAYNKEKCWSIDLAMRINRHPLDIITCHS